LKRIQKKVRASKPKPIAKRIAAIKAKLTKARNPVRIALLRKQLKCAKKVATLKKALKNADPVQAKKIKAKLLKVRKALVRVAAKARKAPKAISVRVANIKAKLAKVTSPVRRAALKKQLRAAKKVAILKCRLDYAEPNEKAALKAKISKARKVLKKATAKVRKVAKRAAKRAGRAREGHYSEVEGASYLAPVVSEGTKLTQEQKEAVKARCLEALDLSTLAQI